MTDFFFFSLSSHISSVTSVTPRVILAGDYKLASIHVGRFWKLFPPWNFALDLCIISITFVLARFSGISRTTDSAYLLVSMHSKSSGMPSTCHKYVDLSCKSCQRKGTREYWGKEGDIVPTLVMMYQERGLLFPKGGVMYLFLHHGGAFIIFTPRVHTLEWWFSSLHPLSPPI